MYLGGGWDQLKYLLRPKLLNQMPHNIYKFKEAKLTGRKYKW